MKRRALLRNFECQYRSMIMKSNNLIRKNLSIAAAILLLALAASAQTTAFSYQGRLTDTGTPGNGNFQMQFKLFDAASGGTQIGSTLTDVPVAVAQGTFSLKLDFGASVFTGADRWVEVAVRRNSGESYTTLDPRDKIVSSPYSLRTLSASQADDAQKLGGVNASEYVTSSNPAGDSFIKNQAAQQAASNFNVSGSGTVGSLTSNGAATFSGITSPGGAAGKGRLYFDSGTNKFRISENGAAFIDLAGAGGVSGSGTVNRLPFFSGATTLSDSVISQVSSNIGVGTTNPSAKLHIQNSATVPRVESTGTTGFAAGWDFYHGATGKGYVGVGDTGASFGANELMLFGGSNVKTSLWSNGARALTVNTNGTVGIGTANPFAALTVTTTTANSGDNTAFFSAPTIGPNASHVHYGTNGDWYIRSAKPVGKVILQDLGGNVGIGMTSPTHALDVYGFFRASHPAGGNLVSETTGGVNSWAKLWMRTPVQSWSIGSSNTFNDNQLYFANETTGQIHMAIYPNGTTQVKVLQITGGSDLAEKFEIAGQAKPGMVVAIDPKNAGKLILARGTYNRQVAGIISGANNLSAGMLLPDLKEGENSMPVALSGRVWVYADAGRGAIKPGDLLTTSTKAGHAMKVTNHRRANGAIIGKAMTELKSGTGLVLVLVSLQ